MNGRFPNTNQPLTQVEGPQPRRQMAGTQPAYNPEYDPLGAGKQHEYAPYPTGGTPGYQSQAGYPPGPAGYGEPAGYGYPHETAGHQGVPPEYSPGPPQQQTWDSSQTHQPPEYHQGASDSHVLTVGSGDQHHPSNSEEDTFKFTEKSIRLGFIKKVFALLFVQLLITAGLMCIFIFVGPVKTYMIKNDWVYITSICLTIVCTAIFAFVTKLRKVWPVNLICLIIMTLLMSTMLGSIACSMEVDEILISVGIVCAVVLVCAIMGVQKRFDFTPMVGFLCMFGMILFSFGFLCIFFYNEVMNIVYCSLGALLFALWLLLDIQLILGGKHKLAFDPEDYVGGALTLYVDIIYMLMMIFFIFKAT